MASVVWSTELLRLLKAPETPANYQFLNQWATREHKGGPALSDGSNNPFFTTAGAGGTVGSLKAGTYPSWNSIGVARYPTLETGVYANALHISTQYPAIAQALRSGNPASQATNPNFQSELSRWSGSGYTGFSSIPATPGPVGPSVDSTKVSTGGTIGRWVPGKGFQALPGQTIPDANAGIISAIPGVAQVEAVSGFLGKLTDPSYLLRGAQLVGGAVLILTGVVLLTRQVALAADLPLPPAGAAIAGAVA